MNIRNSMEIVVDIDWNDVKDPQSAMVIISQLKIKRVINFGSFFLKD
jgi:hypothetical protein